MLSEVDFQQPSQEARELTESGYNLRAKALQEILQHRTSVKTVRLRLQLGRELARPWVPSSFDGLLVLKP